MTGYFAVRDPGKRSDFPVGSRVSIETPMEDHHFFHVGETGVVVRHGNHDYLGVIVRLDRPFRCNHGHYEHVVEEFNFSARDLEVLA